ncbi:hypothetical protein [Candidatus Nitrospira inopinata]|jgi:type I restriction enzyme R subunit|uniref:Uncharacterized protein n=1 Tax=Candidatus Nitrospira inopinata TaxID=1715989 RepID=A0A0S4KUR8_9BACT|nr:hypothetical protein [Candidatus Nitrospira inopinata]CUQ67829.1 protein of unknown function [Candidatus Nitrospira inopinata]
MTRPFMESDVEQAALAWLKTSGWPVAHGPDISPSGNTLTLALSQREREHYGEVVLAQRLRDALPPTLVSGKLRATEAINVPEAQRL